MTQLLIFAGSLAGVLGLAWFAHWLRLGGDARLDEAEARDLAEAQGYAGDDVALDRAGMAALVRDDDRGFLLIRRHGANFVAEPLTGSGETRLSQQFLTVGAVTLDLGAAAGSWAAKLRTLPV